MIYLKPYGLVKGADDVCDDCAVLEAFCPMLEYARAHEGMPFEVWVCENGISSLKKK